MTRISHGRLSRAALAIAAMLATTGALAACGPSKQAQTSSTAHATTSAAPAATANLRAARPLPDFQGGVIVYADGNDPALLSNAGRLLDHLVSVKVKIVALAFPLYQTSWTSTDVHADPTKTPTSDFLTGFIEAAHKRSLAVLLRPLIDDTPLKQSGHWRGQLQPSDAAAWFASYKTAIVGYANLAKTEGAEVLDIGTELNSLQTNTAAWQDVISAIRSVYSGQLTYSSNWDVPYPAFGGALDFASIDAFYPLSAPNNATVGQLVSAWGKWTGQLRDLKSATGKPVVLTELGTTSEPNSYQTPYNWTHGGQVSLEAQRAYYAASCQALKPVVGGMYWWVYYTNWFDKVVPQNDPGYQPIGKPAEKEITSCYQ